MSSVWHAVVNSAEFVLDQYGEPDVRSTGDSRGLQQRRGCFWWEDFRGSISL